MNASFSFKYLYSSLFALVLFLFWATPTLADCGSIMTPDALFEPDSPFKSVPIEDCANPFNADNPEPFTYTVTIDNQPVSSGSVITVTPDQPIDISFSIDTDPSFFHSMTIFKMEGQDYVLPSYTDMSLSSIDGLEEGEYVAVLTSEPPPVVTHHEPLWKKWLKQIFLPHTTYAFFPDYVEVVVFPFTIEHTVPEPTGASSVLFLPGIMGSRLYEESGECDNENKEQERWVSTKDCDQLRLATDVNGDSINDIYTKRYESSIVDEVGVSISPKINIYKSFLKDLKDWKEDEMIDDYAVVPYDWRLKLDDILKSKSILGSDGRIVYGEDTPIHLSYVYEALFTLVQSSDTGKVTIVAHSNGGLVAKQLLAKLEADNDPLLDKVDNLILVAVPQIGSAEDVIGILHGSDVGPAGLVMEQKITRQLMNTMPFARHLLPTETYFNTVSTPIINFIPGESTQTWYDTYDHIITTKDELHHFLSTESGREKPQTDDLTTPEVINGSLLAYADETSEIQSNWTPASTTKVYQIAGAGLLTPANITYFTDQGCVDWDSDGHCLATEPKLGYFIQASKNGDETVSVPSALAMDGEEAEKWWVNLYDYNRNEFPSRQHANILEVPDISHFIANTIESTTTRPYTYLTNTPPAIPDIDRLVFQLHSPLDLSLTTDDGEISSSTNTISGATYRRYGELQYLSIPKDENDITLHLKGIATGSFTLDIEEAEGDTLLERHTYSAIPSATGTIVTMEIVEGTDLEETILEVDYDGDGVTDIQYDTEGEIIEEVTYDQLLSVINDLDLKRWHKFILLNTTKVAKKLHDAEKKQKERKTLKALKGIVLWYQHSRLVSVEESDELARIIDSLINKI